MQAFGVLLSGGAACSAALRTVNLNHAFLSSAQLAESAAGLRSAPGSSRCRYASPARARGRSRLGFLSTYLRGWAEEEEEAVVDLPALGSPSLPHRPVS